MREVIGRHDVLSDAHQATIAVARRFLETLGRGDMEALIEQWHDAGRLEFPFSPTQQAPVQALRNLRDYFLGTRGHKRPRGFPVRAIYPCADPSWAVIEFQGELTNTRTGEDYTNDYIVVIQVENGKVRLFREFFDSLTRAKHES